MAGSSKRLLFDTEYPLRCWGKTVDETKESIRKDLIKNFSADGLCGCIMNGWMNILIIDVYIENGRGVDDLVTYMFEDERYTVLHFCARFGDPIFVQRLLYHGADINSLSANNTTPLCLAILWGRIEIVQLLLKADPDIRIFPNHDNYEYLNIVDVALGRKEMRFSHCRDKEYEDIADLLLEYETSKFDIKSAGKRR